MRVDLDSFEEILIAITRNKTRSVLTAFGVFWGIFMLIILLGGSRGLQDMLSVNFEGFASNSGFTYSEPTSKPYKGFRKGRYWNLENRDIEIVRQAVPEVDVVTPSLAKWGMTAVAGENKISCTVKGAYPDMKKIEDMDIRMGRSINDMDIKGRRKVCIMGKWVYETLFPKGGDPCGSYIRIDGIYYQVVGVSFSAGNMNIQGQAQSSITLPFTTMQENYNFGKKIDVLCYTAKSGHPVSEVQEKIEKVIKEAHFIHPDDKQAVLSLNAEAMFSMVDNLFKGINILGWMVGLGTLLAGAIGVSNIMMVTVKERTVEIGIRRAIGAKPSDIMGQILSESMVLTIMAGMAGISFGVLVLQMTEILTAGSGTPAHFQISFWMAIGACALLMVLGVLAGLAPAYRAMSVKPVEAIGDE